MTRVAHILGGAVLALGTLTPAATAQPLGAFTWQLQPFCNRVTVNVRQDGTVYTLDGTDDQCGASQVAPVVGLATPNPDGSIGFGLTVVTSGAAPVHVSARVTLPSVSGTWTDSAGNGGAFILAGNAAGSPRPAPAAGAGDITEVAAGTGLTGGGTAGAVSLAVNPAVVQSRVTTACAAGQALRSIAENGTAVCEPVSGGGAGGDITGVAAGTGLSGGGTSGDVTLTVNFGGDGSAASAARADHEHTAGGTRTVGVGPGALGAAPGADNTAVGAQALGLLGSAGSSSTAVGSRALEASVGGDNNTAVGAAALVLATGSSNTAVGTGTLQTITAGNGNTALGRTVWSALGAGSGNTGLGLDAGNAVTTATDLTLVGARSDAASALVNASAIGADAFVTRSNAVVLGSISGVNAAASDANVGIGTTAPNHALEVARNDDATVRLDGYGASANGVVLGSANDGTRAAPAASSSARDLLSLEGDARGSFNAAGGPPVRIVLASTEGYTGIGRGSRIRFETTPTGTSTRTTSMVLDASGFLGLGTTSPTARVDLASQTIEPDIQLTTVNVTPDIVGRRATGTLAAPGAVGSGQGLLILRGQGYTGTTYQEAASIVFRASEGWTDTANGAELEFYTTPIGSTSWQERMVIAPDGDVGIGTTAPLDRLHVGGDIRVGTSGTNGCVRNFAGTPLTGTCASDRKFKRDITPFAPMLDRVAALRPVHYFWRREAFPAEGFGADRSYGLIAQEVEAVLPELVSVDADGSRRVDYARLPLLAIQAIRELKDRNEVLEQRLAAVERALARR